jgi:hypothetical protein
MDFYTKRVNYRRGKYSDIVDDETYLALHWTKQEKVKRRYPKPYDKGDPGDFDNRTDNFDIDESREVTQ